MNRKNIAVAMLPLVLAGGAAIVAPAVASAKPAICNDISVPAKVRWIEGCFHPDSTPALPPGDATFTPPAPDVAPEWTFEFPEINFPEPEAEPTEPTEPGTGDTTVTQG